MGTGCRLPVASFRSYLRNHPGMCVSPMCDSTTGQFVIAIKLGAENTIVLDSCIKFYMFTNISDVYTKYATSHKSAKCNLNATNLEINS